VSNPPSEIGGELHQRCEPVHVDERVPESL